MSYYTDLIDQNDEERRQRDAARVASVRAQATATAEPEHGSGFFGSIAHAAGNVGHAVGNVTHAGGSFFGGIVHGIVDPAVDIAKAGAGEVEQLIQGPIAERRIKEANDMRKKLQADFDKGDIDLKKYNERMKDLKAFQEKTSQIAENKNLENTSQKKIAAAGAETLFNIATVGGGTAAKAVAEQTGKQILKSGGTKVATDILTSNIEKKAAADAAKAAANRTAAGAAKTISKTAGIGAAITAPYAALDTVRTDDKATAGDIFHSALFGAGLGAVGGGGLSLLDRNVRAGAAQIPAASAQGARDSMGQLVTQQAGHIQIPGRGVDEPLLPSSNRPDGALQKQLEDAWNTNDYPAAQKVIDQMSPEMQKPMQKMQIDKLKESGSPLDIATAGHNEAQKQLSGLAGDTARPVSPDDIIVSTAAQYHSPEQYVAERAKQALDSEKGQRGGQLIPNGEGGYKRTSDHAQWYSDLYRETGRQPTLEQTRDLVRTSLETGKGGKDLVHPEESQIMQLLKANEGDPGITMTTKAPLMEDPNQRGFFGTLQESKATTPELKAGIAEQPQTYTPKDNAGLVDRGRAAVDADTQTEHNRILTASNLTDEDISIGSQLMSKAQKEGRIQDAVAIADKLDTSLRDSGRAVQAASIWSRLSPEGVLRFAAKKFRDARTNTSNSRSYKKGVGNETSIANDLQGAVDNIALGKDDVTSAVQSAAKAGPRGKAIELPAAKPGEGQLDINGNPLTPGTTTGEQIAGRVEKLATPEIKKQANVLVNEITKKVKQEMIEAKPTAPPKSPLDVMKEVFGRNAEAQQAFPEAQRILRDKFANNPEAQATLDKFFSSELGMPAAGSTINASIKEQLAKNETKISDIIHKSWNGQKQSVDDVAAALTKEGFDQQSATVIAKEVTDRLTAQTVMAKQRALKQLAKDAPERAKSVYLDKVNKLSNLGGLDNHDYLEMARAKLKLPQLTQKTATELSELSQKMQDMPEGFERDQVAKQIYETVNSAIPKSKMDIASELISAPKSLMASADLSGTLRQGGVLGARFRTEAKEAFKKQVLYFKDPEAYARDMSAIRHHPLYELARKADIDLTGTGGAEEAFASPLPEKIPLLGKIVGASDRSYTGGLTELRFKSFAHIIQDLADEGITGESLNKETLESIGKFINTASGRGHGAQGGLFEKVAPALNRTLFSPRLWKSRLDMLNPAYYYKLDPIARKYAIQSAGSFAAIAGTVLGLAALAGAKVESDPRSSDFLKIRVGDTRYDILGGFGPNLVFAARELSGEKKNSSTGEVTSLTDGSFAGANRLSVLSDLIENKANPVLSTGADILKGTDKQGNPVNPASEIAQLGIPLNIQDTYSLGKKTDPITAVLGGLIPGTLGIGVNTYSGGSSSKAPKATDAIYGNYYKTLYGR